MMRNLLNFLTPASLCLGAKFLIRKTLLYVSNAHFICKWRLIKVNEMSALITVISWILKVLLFTKNVT